MTVGIKLKLKLIKLKLIKLKLIKLKFFEYIILSIYTDIVNFIICTSC